ncbi:hypothetical protein CHARACLAT_008236 [Characodon lateralis]|uniref:G-protein coupled receptors family 1 profile domain-containing protein n=1 Tax=Characodon lateralis TaxID=208331 RepID=A0ABU7CNT0_9TELE|nr:hypothetical protein [Characodon lateralis]
MINLSSTDFMYELSLPFLVASYIMRDRWVSGDFMCCLVRFLFYLNLYCSIFFLTCISAHRYLGICHPIKVITLETKKAVLVWIVSVCFDMPYFSVCSDWLHDQNGRNIDQCKSNYLQQESSHLIKRPHQL